MTRGCVVNHPLAVAIRPELGSELGVLLLKLWCTIFSSARFYSGEAQHTKHDMAGPLLDINHVWIERSMDRLVRMHDG